jgi:DHA1 family solute carrier family 18 vesicular amine transporter 1/2
MTGDARASEAASAASLWPSGRRRWLVLLATAGVFIDVVSYSVAVPVLSELRARLDVSPTVIGLLFSSFGVTLLTVSIPMGRLSDRIGRRVPLVLALVALATSSLIFGLVNHIAWLFIARLIQGAADAVAWVVGFALVADLYAPEDRGRVLGVVMAGANAGLMVGPTLGGWLYEAGGFVLPFVAVAIAALVLAVMVWGARMPPAVGGIETLPLLDLVRRPPIAACAAAVAMAAATVSMLEPVVSLWLGTTIALSPSRIGLVFGAGALVATVCHPIFGRLADRWGGRRLTMLGLVAVALILPVLSLADAFGTAMIAYALEAAAIALVVTPSLAYMADVFSTAGGTGPGVVYGIYNVAWGVGLLFGPSVGGFAFDRVGFSRLAWGWALCAFLAAVVLWCATEPERTRRLRPAS